MSVRLLIAGAGGHAREIAALLEDINRAAASAPWLLAAFVVDPDGYRIEAYCSAKA